MNSITSLKLLRQLKGRQSSQTLYRVSFSTRINPAVAAARFSNLKMCQKTSTEEIQKNFILLGGTYSVQVELNNSLTF
jgi:hypothetical protein